MSDYTGSAIVYAILYTGVHNEIAKTVLMIGIIVSMVAAFVARMVINGKPDQWVRRHVTDWEIVDE
jgi:hypothetical protein